MASSPVYLGDPFVAAANFVIDSLEGGGRLTDHPSDAGKVTRWGISQRAHPQIDVRTLDRPGALRIYHDQYWLTCYGDNLDRPLALLVFAAWVNMPPREAAKCLQRAVTGVKVDGSLGSRTLGAARRFKPQSELRARFSRECIEYYIHLCERVPFHRPNLHGWIGRVCRVADEAGKWGAE